MFFSIEMKRLPSLKLLTIIDNAPAFSHLVSALLITLLASPVWAHTVTQCPASNQTLAAAPNKATSKKADKKPQAGSDCDALNHKVVSGETWRTLALKYLGTKSKFAVVANLNGRDPDNPAQWPKIGETILVPCVKGAAKASKLPAKAHKPAAKTAAPASVWTAKKGDYIRDLINVWSKKAGYKVLHEGVTDWQVEVPLRLTGGFQEVLAQLVKGFAGSGRPLTISIYSNKVIKVGNP